MRKLSIVAAATTSALIAGFFYAYSSSVNRGLGRLGDAEYIAAMQAINDTVRNPVFALSFFGALIALPVAALLHRSVRSPRSRLLIAAAVLYVAGGFGVTLGLNVPLNDQLAGLHIASASPAEMADAREAYESPWNAYNAIRTVASTLALVCVAAAALSPGDSRPPLRRSVDATATSSPIAA